MARLDPVSLGIALVLVFTATIHQARCDEKCRTGCHGVTPHYFKYAEGTTYKYNYEGSIDILVSSAENQQSTTKVRATVLLTQLPQCNQILRIQNFQITGSDAKKYSNIDGIDKPVQLNFHDGHVEDFICTDPADTQNSLNFKRAVASMFQAAHKRSTETDVFGTCPTDFAKHNEGNTLVIKKNRNLNRCSHRESISNDFVQTSFNFDSEIKTSPFLKGEVTSEQRIKNGIMDHVLITENYLYVPFSVGSNGAKGRVQSKLTLAGTSKENPKASVSAARSIIFENPHPTVSDKTNVNSLISSLKSAASTVDVSVKESSAAKFVDFTAVVKRASAQDLRAVFNKVRAGAGFGDKAVARKIFLDGLFQAGTGDAIEVAIELYVKKQLDSCETKWFLLGLNLVKHVTPNALKAAVTLLGDAQLPREAYLGVGILAGRYCRSHSCKNVPQLNTLLNALGTKITAKIANRDAENTAISSLKAIHNTGHVNDDLAGKIVGLAQNKNLPTRLRVAALETYPADPCRDKFRDSAVNILKDIQQDSEIRIKAYLAAAECPNGKVANAVKALLENEPSYQVGGFIASHLGTLRTSTNPDKALAKAQLGQIRTTKKYPFDIRKYSYNTELSYNFDSFGVGSSVEANVIYSQKSFLPRYTSLNLTAEVFGHTFNFLEIDARQENLDRLLEHYLGPVGLLRKETPGGLYSKGKNSIKELAEKFSHRLKNMRGKRDIPKAQLDYISKQLTDKQNDLNKDMDLDIGIKMFGSEALFLNLNEELTKYTPDVVIDTIFDFLDKRVKEAKNFDQTLRSNMIFLDTEVVYPTSLGFPLRLQVEGTSAIQVKTSGKIDLLSLLDTKGSTDLKFTLIPSANIQVLARWTLDAGVIQSGLKVVNNLYSATGAALDLNIDQYQTMDYKLSLPVDKQQLVTVTHNLVFETRTPGEAEVNNRLKFTESKDFSVCVDHLSQVLGLTFCAEINQPNVASNTGAVLPYPLNGNSKFSLYINKNDLDHFHYREAIHVDDNKLGYDDTFEVIGKQKNQLALLKFEAFLKPEAYVKATLKSVLKNAVLEGRLVNTNAEKSVFGKVVLDSIEYYGKIGAVVSGGGQRTVYRPVIEFKLGEGAVQKAPYNIEGQLVVETAGDITKYKLENIKLIAPNQSPIMVTGNVGYSPNSVFGDLTANDGRNNGRLQGNVELKSDGFKLYTELQNSVNPLINFKLNYNYEMETKPEPRLISDLKFVHGADLSSKVNVFTLTNNIRGSNDDSVAQFYTKNKLSYPATGLSTTFNFEVKPKFVEYEFDFTRNKIKLGSDFKLNYDKKNQGDYDADFELYGLDNKIEFDAKREVTGHKSKISNKLVVNKKSLDVSGIVNHLVDANKVDVGSDLTIKFTGQPDIKFKSVLKYNPNEIDTSLKITSGSTAYVDVLFKQNKAGAATGKLKIDLKDAITANGDLTAQKGKGSGNLVVQIPKVQRKIKVQSTFTVQDPTYNFDVTLFPNFDKSPSKKFRLSTNNAIKPDFIDSKNVLDLDGFKTDFNVKGSYSGDIIDGKHNGEFELAFPDVYFTGKLDRERHVVNNAATGNVFVSLERRDNKNTPGRKISLKGVAKNTNFEEGNVDITYNFVADDGKGQTFYGDFVHNVQKQGDRTVSAIHYKLHGSVLPERIDLQFNGDLTELTLKYTASGKYGHTTADLTGNYDVTGNSRPYTSDFNLEFKSPTAQVKTVRISADGSLLIPGSQENLVLKGTLALLVDSGDATPLDIKSQCDVTLGPQSGQIKGTFQSKPKDPITVSVGYGIVPLKTGNKYTGEASLQYERSKNVKGSVTVSRPNTNEFTLDLTLDTPLETAKKTTLQMTGKRSSDGNNLDGQFTLTVDGKAYVVTNAVVLSEHTPRFSSELKYPDGKVDVISFKVTNLGEKSFAGDAKLVFTQKDFTFVGGVDINAENPDNFKLKINADSAAMKLNKVAVTALTKEVKGNKRIQFSATEGGKNILSGSTTYKLRDENGKLIIEGSGNFKVKDASKSGNFKYIRQNINTEAEQGIEISFNAALGMRAIVAEFQATNKHFKILQSYCEENKQCSHIELDSKTSVADFSNYNNVLEINIDLRKLGLSHEFGLKSVTQRKEFELDHTVDVHFESQKNKYQYSVYVHPRTAGITLTTPKRVMSIEGNLQLPPSGKVSPVKGEVLFYWNKKAEPNKKLVVGFVVDSEHHGDTGKLAVDVTFNHPSLKTPLSANYNSRYDLAAKTSSLAIVANVFPNSKKLKLDLQAQGTAEGTAYGAGYTLNVDLEPFNYKLYAKEYAFFDFYTAHSMKYDLELTSTFGNERITSAVKAQADPRQAVFNLKVHNNEILDVRSNMQLTKESQVIDTVYKGIGFPQTTSRLEAKNFNTLKVVIYRTANPNTKLQISSALIPGQIADFRMDLQKEGKKIDMMHSYVKLDEADFMKTDYAINPENIKEYLYVPVKTQSENVAKELNVAYTRSYEDTRKHFTTIGETAKQNAPDFKPLVDHCKGELLKFKDEIISDKSIQQFSESLANIVSAITQTVTEILTTINDTLEQILTTVHDQFVKLSASVDKDLMPYFNEFVGKIAAACNNVFEKFTGMFFALLAQINDFLSSHQAEFKQIASAFSGVTQDVGRFVMKTFQQIKTALLEELESLRQMFNTMPIFKEIENLCRQLIQGLPVPENIIEIFENAMATLKDMIGLENVKSFIDLSSTYLVKKMRRQDHVNDFAEIESILKVACKAIKEIFLQLDPNDFRVGEAFKTPLFTTSIAYTIPRLVAAKFSPINRVFAGDYPELDLTSVSFNPKSWFIPFRLTGLIVQGQHIFTFDGKHLTFPGKCNYLIARDFVNGNFTIAGTYTNGILTEISMADKTDTVTIKKTGQVLLNAAATEFPVRRTNIDAYRTYTTVNIASRNGAEVTCNSDLSVCQVSISGYYHGQLRGLLGNGNSEPYDDYTTPKGTIVTSESDFGNSYKMNANCPNVKTVDHSTHHHVPTCNKLFGPGSDLALCYPFVDPANYRQACDHGVAGGVPDTEKNIAAGYVAICESKYIPVDLPAEYVKCTNGDQPMSLNEKFSVKTPQKAADIVIAVDVSKSNEPVYKELVKSMADSLKTELGSRGIKDVVYHLITYGDNKHYASHVTTNGGKMTLTGKLPANLKFVEPSDDDDDDLNITTDIEFIDFILNMLPNIKHDIDLATGNTPQAQAYSEAVNYPFRANALKAVIAVTSAPCEKGVFFLLQLLRGYILHDESIGLYLITPVSKEFKIKDEKTTKTVIGFSEKSVFTFAEAKKKPQGNTDLGREIDSHDYCIDFTVENDGLVFITDNFLAAKGNNRKLFPNAAAFQIAENMATMEKKLDCSCERDGPWDAKNVCELVSKNRKPPSGKKMMRG